MLCGGVSMPWSDVLTICGLFAVQCIYGLYMMFLDGLLAAGVPSLFVIVVACAASSVVVLPFAFALERKKWPKVWSPMLVLQLVVISLGGVSIYQVFMMLGVERTSPAIASAMPNLGPGFIFVIAACLRFERFNWKCKYTRAKDLGHTGVPQWGNAAALKRFPAPLSVCSITAMMGAIFSAIIQVLMEGKLTAGTADNIPRIIAEIVLCGICTYPPDSEFSGGVVIGLCTTFQVSSFGRKGPVLVSMFSPFQTVFSALISLKIFFGQWIGLGCFLGIVLMFVGLYVVLWAKNREDKMFTELTAPPESECDLERPLLQ
ncbi:WAT1-related protein At5g47470-like [Panicum virgatum]|uniref:WAT1-related protein At5g47470-like n=1 Tax=Panicum virgatum TaxID=38727 RepID=UPI0019D5FCE8|nr:WAT1-related protein At5g47470-like [Panicum virgatum]